MHSYWRIKIFAQKPKLEEYNLRIGEKHETEISHKFENWIIIWKWWIFLKIGWKIKKMHNYVEYLVRKNVNFFFTILFLLQKWRENFIHLDFVFIWGGRAGKLLFCPELQCRSSLFQFFEILKILGIQAGPEESSMFLSSEFSKNPSKYLNTIFAYWHVKCKYFGCQPKRREMYWFSSVNASFWEAFGGRNRSVKDL